MRRYLETLFRFKELFVVPVILLPVLAFLLTFYVGKQYKVEAAIWVDPSQLLAESLAFSRIAPSEREAQALREWLDTEAFRQEVIDSIGLSRAIEEGQWPVVTDLQVWMSRTPVVRSFYWRLGMAPPSSPKQAGEVALRMVKDAMKVASAGNNLIRVTYQGPEPYLGKALVERTLSLYSEKAIERQVKDSKLGVEFYTRQAQIQSERKDRAAEELRRFLEQYPDPIQGQVRPAAEISELTVLRGNYQLEETLLASGLRTLEQVRIAGEAAVSNRNASFRIVDRPQLPDRVEMTTSRLVVPIVIGFIIGMLIGLLPILLLTWAGSTAQTSEDAEKATGKPVIVRLPPATSMRGRSRHWVREVMAQTLDGTGIVR